VQGFWRLGLIYIGCKLSDRLDVLGGQPEDQAVKPLNIDFVESFDKDAITRELRRIAQVLGKSTLSKDDVKVHGR
jgi:hypothetical protein